jgi:hypothetical protein
MATRVIGMGRHGRAWLLAALAVSLHVAFASPASEAQVRRYEPSRPTVSPYLNLFRNDDFDNRFVPNYHTLVRPLQQQYDTNQRQQRLLQQQNRSLQQLERDRNFSTHRGSTRSPARHRADAHGTNRAMHCVLIFPRRRCKSDNCGAGIIIHFNSI